MSDFALTPTGLTIQPLSDIQNEIGVGLQTALNAPDLLVFDPASPEGALVGILAERESLLQELAQALYDGSYPDTATGSGLDRIVRLAGLTRKPATRSSVTLTLTATGACVIPAGSIASVFQAGGLGAQFITQAAVVFGGAGSQTVAALAAQSGPAPGLQALAHTISVIVTAVANWSGVDNVANATPGVDVETDAALRLRLAQSFALPGQSPIDALRAQLVAIVGVQQAVVLENTTLVTDANGVHAKSVNAIVWPDPVHGSTLESQIVQVIWDGVAGGIEISPNSASSVTANAVDYAAHSQPVHYSIATATPFKVKCTCTPAATSAEIANIKAALQAFAAALLIGQNVSYAEVVCKAVDAAPGKQTYAIFLSAGTVPPSAAGQADVSITPLAVGTLALADVEVA
ncbi:MAG: baseplate J/gp47 family protein [Terriglobales bacterium]